MIALSFLFLFLLLSTLIVDVVENLTSPINETKKKRRHLTRELSFFAIDLLN